MHIINKNSPRLYVSEWIQGGPIDIEKEKGNVIFIEFFQVNCPGCFLYGIPETIKLFEKFKNEKIKFIAISTAFEDFDKNTAENTRILVNERKLIGEPYKVLKHYNLLDEDEKYPYEIRFPVAFDLLLKPEEALKQNILKEGDIVYFENSELVPVSFVKFQLQGTPSTVIIDKNGIIRYINFGKNPDLTNFIESLLK
jgi:thiol-disulfide isomerase/thioredoxin